MQYKIVETMRTKACNSLKWVVFGLMKNLMFSNQSEFSLPVIFWSTSEVIWPGQQNLFDQLIITHLEKTMFHKEPTETYCI